MVGRAVRMRGRQPRRAPAAPLSAASAPSGPGGVAVAPAAVLEEVAEGAQGRVRRRRQIRPSSWKPSRLHCALGLRTARAKATRTFSWACSKVRDVPVVYRTDTPLQTRVKTGTSSRARARRATIRRSAPARRAGQRGRGQARGDGALEPGEGPQPDVAQRSGPRRRHRHGREPVRGQWCDGQPRGPAPPLSRGAARGPGRARATRRTGPQRPGRKQSSDQCGALLPGAQAGSAGRHPGLQLRRDVVCLVVSDADGGQVLEDREPRAAMASLSFWLMRASSWPYASVPGRCSGAVLVDEPHQDIQVRDVERRDPQPGERESVRAAIDRVFHAEHRAQLVLVLVEDNEAVAA